MEAYKPFTERVMQATPEILSLRMRPLTLGHIMILKAAGSKFLVGDIKECDALGLIQELIFAALVCSTTYDDFKDEIHNGKLVDNVKEFSEKLMVDLGETKFKKFLRNWFRKYAPSYVYLLKPKYPSYFNILDHIREFVDYVNNGTTAPLYVVKESSKEGSKDGNRNNPVEPEEAIISTLMSECGYNRNECLNLPLTEVLSAYLLHAHKQEAIVLISKDTSDLMEQMKGNK